MKKVKKILLSNWTFAILLFIYLLMFFAIYLFFDNMFFFGILAFHQILLAFPVVYIVILIIAKRPWRALVFFILSVAVVISSLPAYFAVSNAFTRVVIFPLIEEYSPKLIEKYAPNTQVRLYGKYKITARNGYAIIQDDSVWYYNSGGGATSATETYLVYSNGEVEYVTTRDSPDYNKTIGD